MDTILDLLIIAGGFAIGAWPVIFVTLLFCFSKRRDDFGSKVRYSIKSLVIAWVLFAVLRLVYRYFALDSLQLIPEPENTRYFFITGVALLPLALAIIYEEIRKHRTIKSIEDMMLLSPTEFEKLVAKVYREQGHKVEEVGTTGDHGIDLVVHSTNDETWLVQCKKYRGKVGEPFVRDFYGVLRASNAEAGAIVTTGLFTSQARLWAEGKPIYLYDGRAFLKIIESTRLHRALPQEFKEPENRTTARKSRRAVASLSPAPAAAAGAVSNAFLDDFEPLDEPEYEEKTPVLSNSRIPECPVCGIPMLLKTTPRFLLQARKEYICVNAPECGETVSAA